MTYVICDFFVQALPLAQQSNQTLIQGQSQSQNHGQSPNANAGQGQTTTQGSASSQGQTHIQSQVQGQGQPQHSNPTGIITLGTHNIQVGSSGIVVGSSGSYACTSPTALNSIFSCHFQYFHFDVMFVGISVGSHLPQSASSSVSSPGSPFSLPTRSPAPPHAPPTPSPSPGVLLRSPATPLLPPSCSSPAPSPYSNPRQSPQYHGNIQQNSGPSNSSAISSVGVPIRSPAPPSLTPVPSPSPQNRTAPSPSGITQHGAAVIHQVCFLSSFLQQ